jgi:hypothetical protein
MIEIGICLIDHVLQDVGIAAVLVVERPGGKHHGKLVAAYPRGLEGSEHHVLRKVNGALRLLPYLDIPIRRYVMPVKPKQVENVVVRHARSICIPG